MRDFLGIPEQRITGEVIVRHAATKPSAAAKSPAPEAKDSGDVQSYAIVVRYGAPTNPLTRSSNADDIDEAIRQSAPSIAEVFDPVGLAAYYFDRRDWGKMGQV